MSVLRVHELRKEYGERVAVDGISFEIAAGELFGLLGPNGAGKTSTISMIAAVLEPTSGDIDIAGYRVSDQRRAAQASLGYVPQDLALYEELSANQNLEFFGRLYGLEGPSLRKACDKALEIAGLRERCSDRVKEFSGGMKRRLNIATSMLHAPKLLILDEPTVGVDPQSRSHIFETLEHAAREEQLAILYTSHQMDEVESLCQRVAILDEGRLLACDQIESLLRSLHDTILSIEIEGPSQTLQDAARLASEFGDARVIDGRLEVGLTQPLTPLLLSLEKQGFTIVGLSTKHASLGSAFLELTGHSLRDS